MAPRSGTKRPSWRRRIRSCGGNDCKALDMSRLSSTVGKTPRTGRIRASLTQILLQNAISATLFRTHRSFANTNEQLRFYCSSSTLS